MRNNLGQAMPEELGPRPEGLYKHHKHISEELLRVREQAEEAEAAAERDRNDPMKSHDFIHRRSDAYNDLQEIQGKYNRNIARAQSHEYDHHEAYVQQARQEAEASGVTFEVETDQAASSQGTEGSPSAEANQ